MADPEYKGFVIFSIKKLSDTGEYKIVWQDKNKVVESKSYYTDDLEDVKDTLPLMIEEAKKAGYIIGLSPSISRFVPNR